MPQLGDTSVFPEAQDIYITIQTGITSYLTPSAYISDVVRKVAATDVDIVEGSEAMPQWGQG